MKPGSENILYYDAIANEYNNMVDTDADRIVREKVAHKFCSIVTASVVLDFGGGTGLDLQWLSQNYGTIFFCEPSAGMRGKAIDSHKGLQYEKVIFLNEAATDFRQWHLRHPFEVNVDAVLSNFAVLNCIPDIELLFRNLSLIVKREGSIIALVLTKNLKKTLVSGFSNIFKSVRSRGATTMHLQYKENRQTVYIYSIKEIVKASRKYFDFSSSDVLPASGFTLLHLRRR